MAHGQQITPAEMAAKATALRQAAEDYPRLLGATVTAVLSVNAETDARNQKYLAERAWVRSRPPIECELSQNEKAGSPATLRIASSRFRVLQTDAQILYGDATLVHYGRIARPYFHGKSPRPPSKPFSDSYAEEEYVQFDVFTVLASATPDKLAWRTAFVDSRPERYQSPDDHWSTAGAASIKDGEFTVIGRTILSCRYVSK